MAERLTKAAARNIFYGGSAFFFAIFRGADGAQPLLHA